jgi:hypothetical protein
MDLVKSLTLLLSHLALGLAGWGIAVAMKPVVVPEAPPLKSKTDRAVPARRVEDALVRRIRAGLAKQAAAKAQEIPPEQVLRKKLLVRLSSLVVPAEPATAFREALESARDGDSELTAAALFVFWAQADPAAALAFIAIHRDDFELDRDLRDLALEMASERLAPEIVLPLVESLEAGSDEILQGLARTLVVARSPQELADLVSEQSEGLKGNLKHFLTTQWPADRLDDFGRFVTAVDDPELLPFGSNQWSREELSVWILRYVNEHPDQGFAYRVRAGSTFTCLLRDNPDLPLQERLEGVQGRNSAPFFADHDVPRFLASDDGPDFSHAFRHGRMEAPQILKLLGARFPEYDEAGLLPSRLHAVLCRQDPVRAAVLLDSLPEEEQVLVMAGNFRKGFYDVPLETVSEALEIMPRSDDEDVSAARREIFRALVDHGLDDYGSDYLQWINTLPEESDRVMALEGIASRMAGSTDWKRREIRTIIGDIQLPDLD